MKRLLISLILLLTACYKNETPPAPEPGSLQTYGSGVYTFTWSPEQSDRPVKVYYHIPQQALQNSAVMMVFHGAGRDALPTREGLKALAEEKGCILLVPEFSNEVFPGSNQYNLGGVFINGESPDLNEMLPESRWTFALVQPLFEDAKARFRFTNSTFDAFGHSAGAQFLHRLLLFQPTIAIERAVSNAAGWYTLPNATVEFPYGMEVTGFTQPQIDGIFNKNLRVGVGALDTDPNSFNLRHTAEADAQGNNRVQRAQYFFQQSAQLAQQAGSAFQWRFSVWPGVGHDLEASAEYAFDLLYP